MIRMFDLIDGIRAKGGGNIVLKHLRRIVVSLVAGVVTCVLIRFIIGKDEIIPMTPDFFGAIFGVLLVMVIDLLRELVRNREVG